MLEIDKGGRLFLRGFQEVSSIAAASVVYLPISEVTNPQVTRELVKSFPEYLGEENKTLFQRISGHSKWKSWALSTFPIRRLF